jgi:uncharacterized protein YjdB
MLRLKRPHRSVVTLLGFSFAVALGCGDGAGSDASVHGAVTGVGDGRASTIQVSPSTTTVEEGSIAPLSCLALDSRGVVVSTSHSWTISDPTVATVAASGAVAAQHPGTAVASCTVDGKTATATINVIGSPVAFLEVTPGAGVLVVGKSLQLVGTPLDSNGAVVTDHRVQWTTADSAIATVSASGSVVGHVEGIANVIAVSGGKAAFAKINVAKQPPAPVASISIRLDDSTLNVGQLAHATATTTDVNGQVVSGRSITWSVDNSSVISAVSTAGDKANVTGRGQGTAVLTATSEGPSTSVTVTVAMAPVQKVIVNLAATSILPGQTTQATAQLTDALGNVLTGRTVTWSSLDPSIATVSAVGVVTGVSPGAVIIRATSEGQTGDGSETVGTAPVATVTVNFSNTTLSPGQTTQATAVARDASGNVLTGRSVSWSSLNPNIATVSTSGVVTAVAAGVASIQATVETKIGLASVTVASAALAVPVPVATVTVTVTSTTLTVGQTTQAAATARDASGNVLTGRVVTWSSLNPSVATVSSTGLVTAVAGGPATIRATVETKVGDGVVTVMTNTITAPTPSSGTLASSDFESGSITPFWNPWSTGIDVPSDPTGGGHGKLARYHYTTNGTTQFDDNKALLPQSTTVSRTLGQEIWFQGDFYIDAAARMDASGTAMVQRKLFKFGWDGGISFPHVLETELTAFGPQFALVIQPQQAFTLAEGTGLLHYIPTSVAKLTAGGWHRIKVYQKINSAYGMADGILRLWYDGILMFDRSDMRWSDPTWTDNPSTYLWNSWAVGYQVNSTTAAVDEYRYWDNVVFSTAAIP